MKYRKIKDYKDHLKLTRGNRKITCREMRIKFTAHLLTIEAKRQPNNVFKMLTFC